MTGLLSKLGAASQLAGLVSQGPLAIAGLASEKLPNATRVLYAQRLATMAAARAAAINLGCSDAVSAAFRTQADIPPETMAALAQSIAVLQVMVNDLAMLRDPAATVTVADLARVYGGGS